MATAHLNKEQIRSLVVHCTSIKNRKKYFSGRKVEQDTGVSHGTFGPWKNGHRNTSYVFVKCREFCDAYFSTHDLPEEFASPKVTIAVTPKRKKAPVSRTAPLPKTKKPPVTSPVKVKQRKKGAKVTLATWNLKNLGKSTCDKRKRQVLNTMAAYDVIAVQELRGVSLRNTFGNHAELRRFRFRQSDPYGNGTRAEALGFMYDKEVVQLTTWHEFNDDERFVYKPVLATFLPLDDEGNAFRVLNVHTTFGKKEDPAPREKETRALALLVKKLLLESDVPLLVVGDFNLDPTNESFDALRALHFGPTNTEKTTTVSANPSVYDHIWFRQCDRILRKTKNHVDSFAAAFDMTNTKERADFRKQVSDHFPLSVRLMA